ncbi:MAG: pilus assembly protein PilP [Xanthomonadales bacterium]|nr:pilus assembly protein PilP [Xanthomonadales bacterium]
MAKLNQLNLITRGATVAALIVVLAGCAKSRDELNQYIADVKARPAGPVDPLPIMKTFETFIYDAHALREPFAPINAEDVASSDAANVAGVGPRPQRDRRKEELERFPLDSLDMVGTLGAADGSTYGLVKDPEGVVHRVLVDNYLGQNDGRITGIFEDRIELVQLISDGTGSWEEQPISIALDDE